MMLNRYLIDASAVRCSTWLLVFLLNLFLPGFLGWGYTVGLARWGMFLGVIICFAIGLGFSYKSRVIGTLLIRGGNLVAISQMLVFLHLIIGSYAVSLGSRFNLSIQRHRDIEHLDSFLGGLIATGFTGGTLMAVSLFAGFVLQLGVTLLFDRWFKHDTNCL